MEQAQDDDWVWVPSGAGRDGGNCVAVPVPGVKAGYSRRGAVAADDLEELLAKWQCERALDALVDFGVTTVPLLSSRMTLEDVRKLDLPPITTRILVDLVRSLQAYHLHQNEIVHPQLLQAQ